MFFVFIQLQEKENFLSSWNLFDNSYKGLASSNISKAMDFLQLAVREKISYKKLKINAGKSDKDRKELRHLMFCFVYCIDSAISSLKLRRMKLNECNFIHSKCICWVLVCATDCYEVRIIVVIKVTQSNLM